MRRSSLAINAGLAVFLWLGGLFGSDQVLKPLLETGSDTGFEVEEQLQGEQTVLRIQMPRPGKDDVWVRLKVPRELASDTLYTARFGSTATPLRIAPERRMDAGRWLTVRAASGTDTTDRTFKWLGWESLYVTPSTSPAGQLKVTDWIAYSDAGELDSRSAEVKRRWTSAVLFAIWALAALAGLVLALRAVRMQDAPEPTTPGPPTTSGSGTAPAPSPDAILNLQYLISTIQGKGNETRIMQEFLNRRLGGEDYDVIISSLEINPDDWGERTAVRRAYKTFLSRLDSHRAMLAYAKGRFAEALPPDSGAGG